MLRLGQHSDVDLQVLGRGRGSVLLDVRLLVRELPDAPPPVPVRVDRRLPVFAEVPRGAIRAASHQPHALYNNAFGTSCGHRILLHRDCAAVPVQSELYYKSAKMRGIVLQIAKELPGMFLKIARSPPSAAHSRVLQSAVWTSLQFAQRSQAPSWTRKKTAVATGASCSVRLRGVQPFSATVTFRTRCPTYGMY